MEMRVEMGTLLASWPDMLDPNFMHTVLLICQHADDGAYGLILNRRTEFTTMNLLPEHPVLGKTPFAVHMGGPVSPTNLQVLHTVPESIPGGVPITERIWMGGDLDAVGAFVAEGGDDVDRQVSFYVGYAGWSPGQLEEELTTGSWLPSPLAPEGVLGRGGDEVWRETVRAIGDQGDDLQNLPPDVRWN